MDYRYFPDPDLLPVKITQSWKDEVAKSMPELPGQMRERFVRDFGLTEYDAAVLTASRDVADYFVKVSSAVADKKIAANWVMGEVAANVNAVENMTYAQAPVKAEVLGEILKRLTDGTVNAKGAKKLFQLIWGGAEGLKQISDASAIEGIIDEVLAANAKMVEEFRSGKQKAFNALVGQAMKATKGKANPKQVNEILRARLGA